MTATSPLTKAEKDEIKRRIQAMSMIDKKLFLALMTIEAIYDNPGRFDRKTQTDYTLAMLRILYFEGALELPSQMLRSGIALPDEAVPLVLDLIKQHMDSQGASTAVLDLMEGILDGLREKEALDAFSAGAGTA